MKILIYATPESKGHHYTYFSAIVSAIKDKMPQTEIVAVLPEKCSDVECRQIYIDGVNWGTKSYFEYFRLMKSFTKIVQKEKPDCIHIQCGDNFYRFFGIGFGRLKKYNPIITFHHMKRSRLRDISLHRIFRRISYGVVHTESLEKMLLEMGIKNVKHIEYPQFQKIAVPSTEDARKQLRLKEDIPVLLALGATRDDKGLDILLDALNFVNHDFQLLIAGKEESFSEEFIDEHTKKYSTKVTKLLKFLDDYKFAECLSAADFVVLPYRKCFDGASGPLGEGVVLGKTIIGPNHGSLGDIIEKNHLGYIFEAENINSLAKVLDKALTRTMQHDKEYLAYQRMLDPEIFAEKYVELFMKVQKHNKI